MAEELTRSLTMLAQRGVPRGAAAVLADARRESTPLCTDSVPRRLRPAWVAATAFAATLVVIGGTMAVGMALRRDEFDVGSISGAVRDVATTSSSRWVLIPVLAGAVVLFALIARNQIRTRKEMHMTATDATRQRTEQQQIVEKPPTNGKWLWLALGVVAAIAVAAAVMLAGGDPVTSPTITFDGTTATYEGPTSLTKEGGYVTATVTNESDHMVVVNAAEMAPGFPGVEAHGAWLANEWVPGTPPPGIVLPPLFLNIGPGDTKEWTIWQSGELVIDMYDLTASKGYHAGLMTVNP